MPTLKIAVAWLKKDDWARWGLIDKELPPYDRWLAKVKVAIDEARAKGVTAVRIDVDPDIFAQWCKAQGRPINRNSRATYAAAELAKHSELH